MGKNGRKTQNWHFRMATFISKINMYSSSSGYTLCFYLRTAASGSSQSERSTPPSEEATCHGLLALKERCRTLHLIFVSVKRSCEEVKTNKLCAVCSAGDERVDEEFMPITGSDMERGVAVFVHNVNLPTWQIKGWRVEFRCGAVKLCLLLYGPVLFSTRFIIAALKAFIKLLHSKDS